MTLQLTTTQTARKQHQCQSCCRVIESGERYVKYTGNDLGQFVTYKECRHCSGLAVLWDLYQWTNWEGYGREDFQEYGRDAARGGMRDARLYVQWTRQWRRRDGTLYPIPERTPEAA